MSLRTTTQEYQGIPLVRFYNLEAEMQRWQVADHWIFGSINWVVELNGETVFEQAPEHVSEIA